MAQQAALAAARAEEERAAKAARLGGGGGKGFWGAGGTDVHYGHEKTRRTTSRPRAEKKTRPGTVDARRP